MSPALQARAPLPKMSNDFAAPRTLLEIKRLKALKKQAALAGGAAIPGGEAPAARAARGGAASARGGARGGVSAARGGARGGAAASRGGRSARRRTRKGDQAAAGVRSPPVPSAPAAARSDGGSSQAADELKQKRQHLLQQKIAQQQKLAAQANLPKTDIATASVTPLGQPSVKAPTPPSSALASQPTAPPASRIPAPTRATRQTRLKRRRLATAGSEDDLPAKQQKKSNILCDDFFHPAYVLGLVSLLLCDCRRCQHSKESCPRPP